MSSEEPVRACICYPHSFAEIKTKAQEMGWTTVQEITAALGCGSGCGHCRPYLEMMLGTGKTAFAVLPIRRPDDEGVGARGTNALPCPDTLLVTDGSFRADGGGHAEEVV
jgi:bacterioferritin-associated ferredoxin